MKSTSTRDVYFKRSTRKEWHKYNTGNSTTVAVSRDYTPPKGPEGYWKEFQGYKYYAFSKDKLLQDSKRRLSSQSGQL